MRYIDINLLVVDGTWQSNAKKAAEAAQGAQDAKERSEVFEQYQSVWKDLKDKLRQLSHEKCWYCESIDPRSDNAVDHYRPKSNVRNSKPPHGGYWWLAFSWQNYRFCCTYCNSIRTSPKTSGGKQDYFPLADETQRASSAASDLALESPLLLDPTNPLDVSMIAFAEDGTVGPADDQENSLECLRANESIRRYHLDHPTINERRANKVRTVRRWVDEADRHLARYVKNRLDMVSRSAAEERIRDIIREVQPRAEYSATVKHLLAGMANKSDAARKVLDSL
jgi:uncharacterized protein (TIGR02646 family)